MELLHIVLTQLEIILFVILICTLLVEAGAKLTLNLFIQSFAELVLVVIGFVFVSVLIIDFVLTVILKL